MKYFIIPALAAAMILGSCNKKEEANVPPIDSSKTMADSVQKAISKIDQVKDFKAHKKALEAVMSLPGAIPPHLLPAKDLKFIDENDSTAHYTFTSDKEGVLVTITMARKIENKDTSWYMKGFTEKR